MMQRRLHLLRTLRSLTNFFSAKRQVLRLFVLLAWLPISGALAQIPEPSLEERQAQGAQLQVRRAALEKTYQQEVTQCYQRFDVTRCRNAAREEHIEANAALRQEELAHSARERLLAAQEAQRRSEEKQREAQSKAQSKEQSKAQEGVAPSTESRAVRDPHVSRAVRDPQLQQRQDNQQRAAYEQKQREAAERRERLENRLRERDKPPADPLPMPVSSKPQSSQ